MNFESLERQIARAEIVLIGLTVLSVALADYYVGPKITLGPLYLIPISYSALTRPWKFTLGLFVLCLVLRQGFSPIGQAERPWLMFTRDMAIAAVFLVTVRSLARLNHERRALFEMARQQRDDLAAEVELAAGVQGRLLAGAHLEDPRLDVFARTWPLKGVGGDYYDVIPIDDNRVGIVIADVAGKGLSAALLMPGVRIAMRSIVEKEQRPEQVVAELNRVLVETTDPRSYATMFFAVIDVTAHRLTYANAGHVPGMLRTADGHVHMLGPGGPPVGLIETARYAGGVAEMPPSAMLVLTTDGVTEALDASGEEFGVERWQRAVADAVGANTDEIVASLRATLGEFRGAERAIDDVTAIVVRIR